MITNTQTLHGMQALRNQFLSQLVWSGLVLLDYCTSRKPPPKTDAGAQCVLLRLEWGFCQTIRTHMDSISGLWHLCFYMRMCVCVRRRRLRALSSKATLYEHHHHWLFIFHVSVTGCGCFVFFAAARSAESPRIRQKRNVLVVVQRCICCM